MTITYKLNESDFLIHHLYIASQSERIKKKRQRNKVRLPIIYLAFAVLTFFLEMSYVTPLFIIIGILWYFLYPLWERRHYINHYKGFISETNKDSFDSIVTLDISNDFIDAKDRGGEGKIFTSELTELNEIPSTIFIRLKGGSSIILPKDRIDNIAEVRAKLMELADYLKIKYTIDDKWEWK